jgi:threonine synthase
MNYISTRGGIDPVDFGQAVLMGLAPDGGLLVPETIPQISPSELQHFATLRFQELAYAIIQKFVGAAIPAQDLQTLIERAYASFDHPDITPLVFAGSRPVLELFHGPTAAFKDVALQWLGHLFDYFLARDQSTLTILGATSGDTGSAAIAGVRGKQRMRIIILHPHGRVSAIQERQMTTVLDDNVHNVAVRGTFDDAQRIVKTLFNDHDLQQHYRFGAVNSINWARILAQTVYYFYAWGQISGGDRQRSIAFSIPTGNFGDAFAGYLAKRMGLPIQRLILATNRNDILSRFVNEGNYSAGEVYQTLSPAMDIQLASNFERYLYYLFDEKSAAVMQALQAVDKKQALQITAAQHQQVKNDFFAAAVTDDETLAQIRETYSKTGYILCPHTAVGLYAARHWPDAVCLATAHPAKFNEAVYQAIQTEATPPTCLQGLLDQPTRCALCDATPEAIRDYLQQTLN